MADMAQRFLRGFQAGFTGVPHSQRVAKRQEAAQAQQLGELKLQNERTQQQKLQAQIRKTMQETDDLKIKQHAGILGGAYKMVQDQDPTNAIMRLTSYRDSIRNTGKKTPWLDSILDKMGTDPAAAMQELQASHKALTAAGYLDQSNKTYGSTENYMDSAGNYYTGTQVRGSDGSFEYAVKPVGGAPDQPVGRLERLNAQGMTPSQVADLEGKKAKQKGIVEASLNAANTAFERIGPIKEGLGQYDELIRLIDASGGDAGTGPIEKMFPSIQSYAVQLDNLRNNMGLQVIAGGNFGALSESELEMALSTAIPTGLDGPELRKWAVRKRAAQEKLMMELNRAAQYFYSGGTIPEWLEQNVGKVSDSAPVSEEDILKKYGVQ